MILLKILFKIILLPVKITLLILAYIIYLILMLVSFVLSALNVFVDRIGEFIAFFSVLSGLMSILYLIIEYRANGVLMKEGIFPTIMIWIIAVLANQSSTIITYIIWGLTSIGDTFTDFAKWFAFEV